MKRFVTLIAALTVLPVSASAMFLSEGATPFDAGETFEEENAEFVGDPVYDINGEKIGTVAKVDTTAAQNRKLYIVFDDGVSEEFTGMSFRIDGGWESGGGVEMTYTSEQLMEFLANWSETFPNSELDPNEVLEN